MRRITGAMLVLGLTACGSGDQATTDSTAAADTGMTTGAGTASGDSAAVKVQMRDANGTEIGTLTVSESGGGVMVAGTLRGLPAGSHGIHLHTTGSCEPPFESAGGHWNPTGKQHGFDNPQGPHHGDMRNIEVGADSSVSVNLTAASGMLRGENGLLDADGASIIVHAGADDYRTDPSGNSGARIACGLIRGQ